MRASWASRRRGCLGVGSLAEDRPDTSHTAQKCGAADVEVAPDPVQVGGAWARSCDVGTRKRAATDAKSASRTLTLPWAAK